MLIGKLIKISHPTLEICRKNLQGFRSQLWKTHFEDVISEKHERCF